MRILLLSGAPCENATSRAILSGLSAGYRGSGHSVTALGVHSRQAHRSRFPRWVGRNRSGRIFCLGRRSGGNLSYYADIRERILSLVRRSDFVHYHHFERSFSPPMAAVWRACREATIPFGATLHSFSSPDAQAAPVSFAALSRGLLEGFVSAASWASAPSRASVSIIESCMPSLAGRLHAVPDGFDPAERDAALAAATRRAARGPFVLCVAGLWRYKGVDILLESWKRVCRRGTSAVLTICGAGAERGRLTGLAKRLCVAHQVRFLGEIPRALLWTRLRDCLFTVVPSRHEVFGMAAVEAMACAKAVVATRSGGPQEILEHGITGLLVPPEDPAALSRAIIRLLESRDLRQAIGRRARRASSLYRWSSVARRYLDLLDL